MSAVFLADWPAPVRAQMAGERTGPGGAGEPAASVSAPPPLREDPLLGPPIDATSYVLGAGDILTLALPGVLGESATLVVDAEGGLVLPGSSGRVEVAGLTLEGARSAVAKALEALVRKRPFALSLRQPRRFKVYVVGAVSHPGAYPASPVTRVSEVIERAGGILPGGSRRNVRVLRSMPRANRLRADGLRADDLRAHDSAADSLDLRADLVAFHQLGDTRVNPLLEGGDVIRVPMRVEEMAVFGGVASPGIYEFVAGETVASAVILAGGPVPGAELDKAWIRRSGISGTDESRVEPGWQADRALAAGDALVVPVTGDFGAIRQVEVSGEVMFPGSYPIQPGADTVAGVLRAAGGLTPAANRAGARLLREAARPRGMGMDASGGGAERVRVSQDSSEPASSQPSPVEAAPPAFSDLPPTSREVVLLGQNREGREVSVAWLQDPLADSTRLIDGDRLHIPRAEGRVRVDGRVRSPGWVPFTPNSEVADYVALAGGYDQRADRSHVLIQRAGRPAQAERARGARPLQDGDTIWVPEKSPRSRWALFRESLTVLAQLATVIIVIDQATK